MATVVIGFKVEVDNSTADSKLSSTERNVKKLESRFEKAKKSAKSFANSMGKNIKNAAKIAAGAMAALAVATTTAFAAGSGAAANFEKSLAEVQTIVRGTAAQQKELAKTAQDLALQFGTSNVEQVKAFYQAYSSGAKNAEQATRLVESANTLALAGLSDTASSLKLVVGTANAFGISLENSERVADVFFKTVEKGVTTIPELTEVFGQVAPFAAKAGVSLEETAAAMAVLTKNGLKSEIASTFLRAAIVKLQAPTGQAAEELERLGLANIATTFKAKGLNAALQRLATNNKVTDKSLKVIFGNVRGLGAALNLSGNSATTFANTIEDMENSLGSASSAAAIMNQTFAKQRDRLAAVFEQTKTTFGTLINESGLTQAIMEKLADTFRRLDTFFKSDSGKQFVNDVLKVIKLAADAASASVRGFTAVIKELQGVTPESTAQNFEESEAGLKLLKERVRIRLQSMADIERFKRFQVATERDLTLTEEQRQARRNLLQRRIEAIQKRIAERSKGALEEQVKAEVRKIQVQRLGGQLTDEEIRKQKQLALDKQKSAEQLAREADAAEQARRERVAAAEEAAAEAAKKRIKFINKLEKKAIKSVEQDRIKMIKSISKNQAGGIEAAKMLTLESVAVTEQKLRELTIGPLSLGPLEEDVARLQQTLTLSAEAHEKVQRIIQSAQEKRIKFMMDLEKKAIKSVQNDRLDMIRLATRQQAEGIKLATDLALQSISVTEDRLRTLTLGPGVQGPLEPDVAAVAGEREQSEQAQQESTFLIGRAETDLQKKRMEELKEQAEKAKRAYERLGERIGSAIGEGFETAISGANSFADALKAVGKALLLAAAQFVAAKAQEAVAATASGNTQIAVASGVAGAEAVKSQAGSGFAALITGPILAAALIGLIQGFAGRFQAGGEVSRFGQSGRGEIPIIAHEGEIVVPVDKVRSAQNGGEVSADGGRRGNMIVVNQQQLVTPTNRVDAKRAFRDAQMPALNELVNSGRSSFQNRRFPGRNKNKA